MTGAEGGQEERRAADAFVARAAAVAFAVNRHHPGSGRRRSSDGEEQPSYLEVPRLKLQQVDAEPQQESQWSGAVPDDSNPALGLYGSYPETQRPASPGTVPRVSPEPYAPAVPPDLDVPVTAAPLNPASTQLTLTEDSPWRPSPVPVVPPTPTVSPVRAPSFPRQAYNPYSAQSVQSAPVSPVQPSFGATAPLAPSSRSIPEQSAGQAQTPVSAINSAYSSMEAPQTMPFTSSTPSDSPLGSQTAAIGSGAPAQRQRQKPEQERNQSAVSKPSGRKRGGASVPKGRHTPVWSRKRPSDIKALRARERRLTVLWWILAALALFFAWASFGLMMRIGFLPTFDLGYSWFDSHIAFFFGISPSN
ncbi:hypothetical protein [Bifidobacterium actinocoloniiforme]|uniref:hypothetical protein n=1 Tax=Bifidobacterium actinocoloniiforme TaxID=638619 RepID=UPI001187474E|nr:hypothetical protein [Bifidobacterium actinocoloniiforme]